MSGGDEANSSWPLERAALPKRIVRKWAPLIVVPLIVAAAD